MYAHLKCGSLTLFTNHIIDFFLSLLNHLLYTGRMDSSVNNKLLKSYSCNLSSNWIKA